MVCAQALHIDSTWFLPTDRPNTIIKYAIPTKDKGIFFVGAMVLKPGGIIPSFPLDTVLQNVLVGKMDSNRQVSWVKVFGGTQDDLAFNACQTPDGGYAVLAVTYSSNGDITGAKGGPDIWLLRLDAMGNLLWQKILGSSESDNPISIANTPDKGFIILGSTNGSDGDVPFHYGGFFSFDWLVVKTDSIGDVQWTKDLGGTRGDGWGGGWGIGGAILQVDSFYYLASSSDSRDHDCTDTFWHPGMYTYEDFHLLKLSAGGNVLWDSSYGGSDDDAMSFAYFDSRDNSIVMVGTTHSNDYMVTGYNGGYGDIWVIKTKQDGTVAWQRTIGTAGDEEGYSLCEGPDGSYIISGTTNNVTGGEDAWLLTLDSGGHELCRKSYGGIWHDNAYSIVPSRNGYATAGGSDSPLFTEGVNCNTNNSGSFISYWESWPLEIKNASPNNNISIFPNPATHTLTVAINSASQDNYTITIKDVLGRCCYCKQATNLSEIDISTWNKGMYIVQIRNPGGGFYQQKILIQ